MNVRGSSRKTLTLALDAAYREIQRLNCELELCVRPEEVPDLTEQLAFWQNSAFTANERAEVFRFAMEEIASVTQQMLEGLLKDIDGI